MDLQILYQTPRRGRQVQLLPAVVEEVEAMLKRLARRGLRATLIELQKGEMVVAGGVEPIHVEEHIRWQWWHRLNISVAEGDLLITSAKKFYLYYVRQNGVWVRQASWTLFHLSNFCEMEGYLKLEHMPPLSTYGGLYRKGEHGA